MSTDTMELQSVETFAIRKEIQIAASIELTFEAVLDELGPEGQMPNGKSLQMKIEPWPGGRWYRDLGNNTGHLWGHVQVIKPPTLLELCGPMPMSYPALNHVQYRLKPEGGGTLLSILHRAMGLIVPEHRDGMPEGWEHGLKHIREIAERKADAARANRTQAKR
ncbi:MAG: SRPBCC domain-containing protein [Gemmataceae bacterium]|nr:SRPBCC domain-containing protein [Gemmataceae bacterium]